MDKATGKGKQASLSAGFNPLVSPKVSKESTSNSFFIYLLCSLSLGKTTDTTVAANEDLERGSSSSVLAQPDPFLFRDALKTSPQLADLRQRRKTGKRLEKYHRRQNNVRRHNSGYFFV